MRNLRSTEIASLAFAMVRQWPAMRARAWWPRERLRTWQLARLRALLHHAYEHVPLYKSKFDAARVQPKDLTSLEDLKHFPLLTKAEFIEAYPHQTLARGFDLKDLVVSRSSGSSGSVLDIAYDARAMTTYILAGLRLFQMRFPYRPWHKQVYVYTSSYPLTSLAGAYPLRFVSTLSPPEQILAQIDQHKPDVLVCYPSHLRQLIDCAIESGRSLPSLKLVSVNSEMSTQAERDAIERVLQCPVQDEYSSEELTRIAAQCDSKNYHVFEDINIVEILDQMHRPTEGIGTVVGTNLHNWAMPMIRYVQNDHACVETSPCPCGRVFARLRDLQGRANDSFVLPSGQKLSSGFLLDVTYEIVLTHRAAIRDFCLIQHAPTDIELQVIPGTWSTDVARDVQAKLETHLKMPLRISLVECLPATATGKRNPIVNLWARNQRK